MKPELKIESFHEPLTLCLIVWTAIEQDFTMFEMKFQVLRVESWNSMRANFVMKKQQQQLWAVGSLEFFVRSLRHSFSPYNFVYFWTRRQQFMSGHKQRFHIQFVLWGSLHSLNFSRLCKLMLTRNFSPICWLHNFELRQDFEVILNFLVFEHFWELVEYREPMTHLKTQKLKFFLNILSICGFLRKCTFKPE